MNLRRILALVIALALLAAGVGVIAHAQSLADIDLPAEAGEADAAVAESIEASISNIVLVSESFLPQYDVTPAPEASAEATLLPTIEASVEASLLPTPEASELATAEPTAEASSTPKPYASPYMRIPGGTRLYRDAGCGDKLGTLTGAPSCLPGSSAPMHAGSCAKPISARLYPSRQAAMCMPTSICPS